MPHPFYADVKNTSRSSSTTPELESAPYPQTLHIGFLAESPGPTPTTPIDPLHMPIATGEFYPSNYQSNTTSMYPDSQTPPRTSFATIGQPSSRPQPAKIKPLRHYDGLIARRAGGMRVAGHVLPLAPRLVPLISLGIITPMEL